MPVWQAKEFAGKAAIPNSSFQMCVQIAKNNDPFCTEEVFAKLSVCCVIL